jgi:hypothetical protein
LQKLRDPRLGETLALIQRVIRDDVRVQTGSIAALNQRVYAVKPKVNGYLDMAVTSYKECIQEMESKFGLAFVDKTTTSTWKNVL